MKKFYFYFLFFILAFSTNTFGQYVRFGVAGGINKCGLSGVDKPKMNAKPFGWFGGFYLDNRVGEYLSVQTELNFLQYQFKFVEGLHEIENSRLTIEEKDFYLSVPFFLKYKRGFEFIFWDVGLGGQVSVLAKTKRKLRLKIDNYYFDGDYYYNYKNDWYNYGLLLHGGLQIKAVNLYARFFYSLRNLYKYESSRDMNINILSFGISYQLNYKEQYPYGRKGGWKGFKYKIKHLFK